MTNELKNEHNAHVNPALDVLDLISAHLGRDRKSVPISELWAGRQNMSDQDLTDGMRMLIEQGAIEFRSGDSGPELAITGSRVSARAPGAGPSIPGES